jgi:hypothetical protein
MLHFEYSFIWCWSLNTTESWSEVPWKSWNVLKENREEMLDRWCENWIITQSQGGKNILHAVKRREVKWIGHIWGRNWHLKHVIEGKIEGMVALLGGRSRRCQMLLDGPKETREYWKLKWKALDRTLWRTRFGRDYDLSYDRLQMNEEMNESDLSTKLYCVFYLVFCSLLYVCS